MYAESNTTGNKDNELVLEFQNNTSSSSLIKRTHRFKYSDCDVVSAIFDEEGTCGLRSMNKILMQLLEHMHQAPEVVVSATPSTFKVQSYHRIFTQQIEREGLGGTSKHLSTDLTIAIDDFDFYD